MANIDEIRKTRFKKLEALKKAGFEPYPARTKRTHTVKQALDNFADFSKPKKELVLAGRIRAIRTQGALTFIHFEDGTGRIQGFFKQDGLGEEKYEFFVDNFDIGDFIEISGTLFETKTGEKTIEASDFKILAKSLLPLPEKWHGLQDKEERYRKRYLDLIVNSEIKKNFLKRQLVFDAIREFLAAKGFLEVQTPILQPIYGGTNARPFESKLNALDMKIYLRISNEMYLKRLIAGGYEKIFEFSPDFRNEGIDKLHNPEFTQVETMWAYANYEDNMKLWPELIEHVVKKLHGKTKIKVGDNELEFKAPWEKIKFIDAVEKHANVNVNNIKNLAEAKKIAGTLEVNADKCESVGEVLINIFEEVVQPKIIQPTIVYDYPKEAAVLAKSENDKFAASFEVIINGWEIALSYCEENNPEILKKKWQEQEEALKRGDQEAQKMDLDFINALEIGMPPTSGVGMGIDRLVMLLTDSSSIRDVIFFPFMKPKEL